MKRITCLGLAVLAGFLILQALMADEPADRSPADMVLDTRLKLIEQGLAKAAPPVQPQEALILLATLKTRIEATLANGAAHPAFKKNEPASLDEFEKLFWSMHVLSNQMTTAGRYFDYAQELKAIAKKYKPKKNDTTDLSILQADWSKLKTELAELRERLTQSDRDWRIARLELADKVLTDSKDGAERLLSALAVDMDGEILLQLLTNDVNSTSGQKQKVKETIEHARKAAGKELLQKSRSLFTGLHWWVRGRYGVGTTGSGLLKDPAALKSADVMFGLLMPIVPPIPTDPSGPNAIPLVDRRHHYLWQFETRQILRGGSTQTSVNRDYTLLSGSITTMSHFY